jgi:(1->4)-alpha-D-glucan 1-alpha-D-glucosylmutase
VAYLSRLGVSHIYASPLFRAGAYVPLVAKGTQSAHLSAFARVLEGTTAITIIPRLVMTLSAAEERPPVGAKIWKDTRLILAKAEAGREYRNVITHQRVAAQADGNYATLHIAEVLADFPIRW